MRILSSVLLLLLVTTFTYGATLTVLPYSPEVHLMGRWTVNSGNSGAVGDWPAIAAQLTLTNASFISFAASTSNTDYVNAIITVPSTNVTFVSSVFKLNSTAATYAISLELNPSVTYTVEVNKRTEPSQGILTFYGFQTNQGAVLFNLTPPARRLEFIGANVLTGYGVEGTSGCTFTPATENAWLTWGPMVARAFSADYHVEAWSGTGVVQSNSAVVGNFSDVPNLPAVFNRTVASDASFGNWNFSSWQPHAVFVNIGENDFATSISNDTFVTALNSFLDQIATTYSGSLPFLIVACGPIITNAALCPNVAIAASQSGAVYVDFQNLLTNPDDFGCGGSPDVSGQLKLANKMIPTVQSLLGWYAGNITIPPTNITAPPPAATTGATTTGTSGTGNTTTTSSSSTTATSSNTTSSSTGVNQTTTGTPSTSAAAVTTPSILTFFGLGVMMLLLVKL